MRKSASNLDFIDLFCGCGGFTLGMIRSGLACRAAIDFNLQATDTLRTNILGAEQVLNKDLTGFGPEMLAKLIVREHVDVIVGGPPCQGFSTARQRDGANHGQRLKHDARRHLYRYFLDYVEFFQPKVFVIENVMGLRTAAGGQYFTAVQHEARTLGLASGKPGYRVHPQTEDATLLGVPQKRRRQLIIGVRGDLPGFFPTELIMPPTGTTNPVLGDAILDLPPLRAGEGIDVAEYDLARRKQTLTGTRGGARKRYLYEVLEVHLAKSLTNHVARPHSERDLRDFARLPEGTTSAELMRQGVEFEFPYDRNTFKDRYTRQSRDRPCSTIVAHLSKDGLMFVHPTQNRSITPREAARVQSFPDWFIFPHARTHSFRLIGNAVPPLIAEAVGRGITTFLRDSALDVGAPRARHAVSLARRNTNSHTEQVGNPVKAERIFVPCSANDAREWLDQLLRPSIKELREMPAYSFLRGWHSLLWLFPELHPDNARDHGAATERFLLETPEGAPEWSERYLRSGWPVALVLIGTEAWRRYCAKEISRCEFYCSAAQRAGLTRRWPRPETATR